MHVIRTADPDADASRISERSGEVAGLLIEVGLFTKDEYLDDLAAIETETLIKDINGELGDLS
jgi:hypothetical protein